MMLAIVAKIPIGLDGLLFNPGQPLGLITTDIPASRLQSLFDAGVVSIAEQTPPQQESPPLAPSSGIGAGGEGQTDEQPESVGDDEVSPPLAPSSGKGVGDEGPSLDEVAAMEFPGLKPRIAIALLNQNINTVEDLQMYIAGGKELVDLNDIGKVAAKELTEWLATVAD